MSVFTWKISDANLLSKIKESKATESFKSDTFTAFGLNWHFELFPNGFKKSNLGQIELFIALQSIPNGISTIILNTKLSLLETNTIMPTKMVITNATMNQQTSNKNKNKSKSKKSFNGQPVSWYYGPKIDEIIKLNQLTFKYEAQLINIKLLNNNQDITKQWLESPSKAIQTHLTMKHNQISNIISSNKTVNVPHSVVMPVGIPMRVGNHNRSPSYSSISQSPMSSTSNSNSTSTPTSSTNSIEHQFNAYKEHINNTMQQWALQVNKRFARMEKEISLMRKTINANLKMNHKGDILSDEDVIIISEQEKQLKLWFKNTVKLPDYYHIFIKNGINDLWVVTLLTMDDIKEMKINKIDHRLQIMHHIKELKIKYLQQPATSKSPSSANLSVSVDCNCNENQNGNAFFDDTENSHNHNRKRPRKILNSVSNSSGNSEFDDEDLSNSNTKDMDDANMTNPAKKQRLN